MELKQRIIRNLEWANKRLKLQGKELDETQLEIIEFCLLHDLQQLTLTDVVESAYLLNVEGQGQVLIVAENIADAMDKLEAKGIKNYAFIRSASLNFI